MPDLLNGAFLLKKYKDAGNSLKTRIIQNEQWYKLRHTKDVSKGRYVPASAWLFNSLAVKHADAMEAIPTPYVTAREPSDAESAEALSKLLPVILEYNDFPAIYSSIWNDKLKHGTGCYGVFWNPTTFDGLGEIEIKRVDILNLFWEPGINDLNESSNLFHVEMRSKDELMSAYKQIKELPSDSALETNRYLYDENVDLSDKAPVVDWYYKKVNKKGKTVIHYCKFTGKYKLFCTEDYPEYEENGIYNHGKYPFVTDVMYSVEGTPCGFGSLDIMKDAQMQIDRMNSAIMENARMAASRRYFIRSDGAVNEKEFADWSRPFVHIQGAGLGEDSIREIKVEPLSDIYLDVIDNKITELKETSGNRDVLSGGSEKGVTSAVAINALKESGNKMTRDMISSSYRAFCKVCNLIVELIRQFYTAPRCFRIVNPNGSAKSADYLVYDNSKINGLKEITNDASDRFGRIPAFDISIAAEKSLMSKREEQNRIAKELYEMGVFDENNRRAGKILLSMMDFEGRDEMLAKIYADEKEN